MPSQSVNPPPRSAGAENKPAVSLDDHIFRFWNDFVGAQIAQGRRDVGRMLEAALGFFFERGIQNVAQDVRRRRHLEIFLKRVRSELQKVDAVLATIPADTTRSTTLPAPYQGCQITVQLESDDTPVQVQLHPGPLERVGQMQDYRAALAKQAAAAEQMVALITDKLVRTRKVVATRLQELSPQLYQQGIEMVARVEASRSQPAVVTSPLAVVAIPIPEDHSMWGRVKKIMHRVQGLRSTKA